MPYHVSVVVSTQLEKLFYSRNIVGNICKSRSAITWNGHANSFEFCSKVEMGITWGN